MISAASSRAHTGMMDPNMLPVKRGPGRPRKVQPPPIDPSVPLHPWAAAINHKVQQQRDGMLAAAAAAASPSTSYRPPRRSPAQPQQSSLQHQQHLQQQQLQQQIQQQQQLAASKHSPQSAPTAAAPISAASFYAQPQPAYQDDVAYAKATPVAVAPSEPKAAMPAPALPRKKVPTRADLDFLLGGSARARASSSAPKDAAVQARNGSTAPTAVQSTSAAFRLSVQPQAAGPSRASASSRDAHTAQPMRPSLQASGSRTSLGEEADISGELHDDGLPLGAEAVMESDHETSFEADIEDADAQNEKDDPNDRDFRLYDRSTSSKSKRLPRLSDMTGDAAANGTLSVDPAAPVKRKRGRPSRASLASAAGKVPGSDIVKPKKKRGRPAQDIYTPEVIEELKAANCLLDLDLSEHQHKMPRLSQLLDRQTRKSLPPEMLKALHRARNTQLQRERRDRMRMQRAQDAASSGGGGGVVKEEPVDKLFPDQSEERKKARKSKRRERGEEDVETGSGSAILERAKGKVSEWIKTISSEAEMSVEPDDPNQPDADTRSRSSALRHRADSPASSTKQRASKSATPPTAPAAAAAAVDTNIDPRLVEGETDDDLVQAYFSRFGTVTGAANKDVARTTEGDPDTGAKVNGETGVVGDEYYFSN